MLERVFLGWERPFLLEAVGWLLEQRDDLARSLVIVPTSQAGRRLREELAEQAGALLAPTFTTPGRLLETGSPDIAADWIEQVAWHETLESIDDWSGFPDLFPEPPGDVTSWAPGLAGEMVRLRRSLQENGLTLAAAANILGGGVEGGRWASLARLEGLVENRLKSWGYRSRSRVIAAGLSIPPGITRVILAGITGMPPVVRRMLDSCGVPAVALIAAPAAEAEGFSEFGLPLAVWSERVMPWPDGKRGKVHLVADHRQGAAGALQVVASEGNPSDQVALCSPDVDTGDELAACFTRAGWTAFHPAAVHPPEGLTRWLGIWMEWLDDPRLATVADLLAMPETEALTGDFRAATAVRLSRLRDDWMVLRPDDLRRRIATAAFRSDAAREEAESVRTCVEILERWRSGFLKPDWPGHFRHLMETIAKSSQQAAVQVPPALVWIDQAAPLIERIGRDAVYWLRMMVAGLPEPVRPPPPGRVIDVQGWLELLFEPGRHLVLCGMNEGILPSRPSGDPWLGEAAARLLGLGTNQDRAARDAFLFHAVLTARAEGGRVDLFCAKTGSTGDSLLPSRLLLAARREDLPARVKFLFQEVEPPEAGLRWHADWQWQPRFREAPQRISVTALPAYLACPFRFYLKHVLRMQAPEPGRIEWNARDFGTMAHDILESWGRDAAARALDKTEAIHEWLCDRLDQVVRDAFGKRPPLAVRIQTESLRQRFAWFSRIQGCAHAEGWEVIAVEQPVEIPVGDAVISAKIDRIDRNRHSGTIRVIDYKTGKVKPVEAQHRSKVTNSTRLPAHIDVGSPVLHTAHTGGKLVECRWTNLQLPLYAAAWTNENPGDPPVPCYFSIGSTENDVALQEWPEFSVEDIDAAMACASWIVGKIRERVFWPPSEKVDYDDYAVLCSGRTMEEMFSAVPEAAQGS